MSTDDEVMEEIRSAALLDDMPQIHLEGPHTVAIDRPHRIRISPFWLILPAIFFFVVGLLIGSCFI